MKKLRPTAILFGILFLGLIASLDWSNRQLNLEMPKLQREAG